MVAVRLAQVDEVKHILGGGDDSRGWFGLWCEWSYAPSSYRRVRGAFPDAGEALASGRARLESLGAGRATLRKLEGYFGLSAARSLERLREVESRRLCFLERLGAWVLSVETPALRKSLLPMKSPPPFIFGRGDRDLISCAPDMWVAVVGSRRVGRGGLRMARAVADEVVAEGSIVVSGGALGVDTAAHEQAISGGGRSIVVLGAGLDCPYPRQNIELFDRIVACGGLVMTPFVPGQGVRRHHFPRRNKIMAAMSLATVVVRAGASSGSLITARAALSFGRTVLSMPTDVVAGVASGTNLILLEGALPLVATELVPTVLRRARLRQLEAGVRS